MTTWISRLAGALTVAALLTGCMTRHMVRIEDHPNQPYTLLESLDHFTYIPGLWEKSVHQFWSCKDGASGLVCDKACGGDTGINCPEGTILATTNTR